MFLKNRKKRSTIQVSREEINSLFYKCYACIATCNTYEQFLVSQVYYKLFLQNYFNPANPVEVIQRTKYESRLKSVSRVIWVRTAPIDD